MNIFLDIALEKTIMESTLLKIDKQEKHSVHTKVKNMQAL